MPETPSKNIECEIRSFITEDQYRELIDWFKDNAAYIGEDEQVTYYFDAPQDLRIQKNSQYAKVWLKKGKIHDEQREEIEIHVPKEDFEKLEQLFLALEYRVSIQWFRKRITFNWQGIDVAIDDTKGYGYIIELEKLSAPEEQQHVLEMLKGKFAELNIPSTSKEEFDARFSDYQLHWKERIA